MRQTLGTNSRCLIKLAKSGKWNFEKGPRKGEGKFVLFSIRWFRAGKFNAIESWIARIGIQNFQGDELLHFLDRESDDNRFLCISHGSFFFDYSGWIKEIQYSKNRNQPILLSYFAPPLFKLSPKETKSTVTNNERKEQRNFTPISRFLVPVDSNRPRHRPLKLDKWRRKGRIDEFRNSEFPRGWGVLLGALGGGMLLVESLRKGCAGLVRERGRNQ